MTRSRRTRRPAARAATRPCCSSSSGAAESTAPRLRHRHVVGHLDAVAIARGHHRRGLRAVLGQWWGPGDHLAFKIHMTSELSSIALDAFQVDTFWSEMSLCLNARQAIPEAVRPGAIDVRAHRLLAGPHAATERSNRLSGCPWATRTTDHAIDVLSTTTRPHGRKTGRVACRTRFVGSGRCPATCGHARLVGAGFGHLVLPQFHCRHGRHSHTVADVVRRTRLGRIGPVRAPSRSQPARQGMVLAAFDTTEIQPGLAPARYQVHALTLTLTMAYSSFGPVFYDDDEDSWEELLADANANAFDAARRSRCSARGFKAPTAASRWERRPAPICSARPQSLTPSPATATARIR